MLNKEYPLFTFTSRIVSLGDHPQFEVFTSPICIAIAFYFAEKKYKNAVALQKIKILCAHIKIAEVTGTSVRKTLQNSSLRDPEDGMEYYAALENKCKCLITEDADDFYFSEIEVLSSEEFFKKYMAGK